MQPAIRISQYGSANQQHKGNTWLRKSSANCISAVGVKSSKKKKKLSEKPSEKPRSHEAARRDGHVPKLAQVPVSCRGFLFPAWTALEG